ncbi:HipA N-terminal domain-containing protein [Adlercreutzia sp. ZJ141]|uniref:HipA N-terminal domain-containing protein n=1 Tax=Adlercreutzia sp. ZJ141 TaxID=2709406 RepID=UPI00210FB5D2|nr:HipA N-terminal domain-containing protein [Adlercreutzia sp. ZJ141]
MANQDLIVYREYCGSFEEVGRVVSTEEGVSFSYSDSYLQNETAQSISHVFPLREGAFPSSEATSFFEGILPEGSMRKSLSRAFHANIGDIHSFLEHLNNESAGALVFKTDGEPPSANRGYLPLDEGDLGRFTEHPREFAPRAAHRSRLSLAGAQMKVGLFFDDAQNSWFYPEGSAPSSHIVKACDGSFPHQTINEAICILERGLVVARGVAAVRHYLHNNLP